DAEPGQEHDHQEQSKGGDGVKGRAFPYVENVRPRDIATHLSLPAHFVEADSRERADQRKARGEREEEVQHVITERQACQKQADKGIDQGEENDVGRHRPEVVDAFRDRVLEIREPDLADDWVSQALARTADHMEIWHNELPSAVLRTVARLEVTQCFHFRRWSRG